LDLSIPAGGAKPAAEHRNAPQPLRRRLQNAAGSARRTLQKLPRILTMPSAEKRGKRWRATAFHKGERIPAGTHDTKAAALSAGLEVERRAKRGTGGAHGKTLRDVFDRYAEKVSPTKRSGGGWEQTRLAYYSRDPIADKRLEELTPDDFGQLRDRRMTEITGATLRRDFSLMSHALTTAKKEWRWLAENPLTPVRRPRDNAPRSRRLQEGELEALRVASAYRPGASPRTGTARTIAAFEFSIETAMRGGEIIALRKIDCHAHHVHVMAGKTEETRDVPLSKRARAILDQVLTLQLDPVFGLTTAHKDALFRKVRTRAGIEGLNFHDARREATTRLAKIYDVLELSRITGHRDLSVLRDVYYRPSIEDLAARMK
jgi:integrase